MPENPTIYPLERVYLFLTNMLYLIPLQVNRFQGRNPQAQILAVGASKARRLAANTAIQHEAGWITSRRAALILTKDRLICGSWNIPLASITSATLHRVKAFAARGLVLKVATDKHHYQFGLQYDPAWERQTALPLVIEDSKIGYSLFSIVIRVILVAYLIWFFLDILF
jgi:hypothetical protein